MTGLRELFQEAADAPAPPTRLVAEKVYAAGRRRRRRRRTVATCASAAAFTTTAVVVGFTVLAPSGPVADDLPTAGRTTPPAGALPHPEGRVQWAGAADAQHLYVAMWPSSSCPATPSAPCAKSIVQLVGSDDGGRTWSDRGTPIDVVSLAVLGPGTLLAAGPGNRPVAAQTVMTSTDGGRTWATAQPAPTVPTVPGGGTAICWPINGKKPCLLHAVDPAAHRIAPLAAQPPLRMWPEDLGFEEAGGRLRVSGTDPATGRPAIAVSGDAGRTWISHVFTDAPPCPVEGCEPPSLAVGADGTAYAVATGARDWAVYRRTGGPGKDGWQRVTDAYQVPYEGSGARGSFVAADGTHVLYQLANDRKGADRHRYWAGRAGGAYQLVQLEGLSPTAGPVRRTADGWFYVLSYADGVLYGSSDGWHWSPVTRR